MSATSASSSSYNFSSSGVTQTPATPASDAPQSVGEFFEEYWAFVVYFSFVIIYNGLLYSPIGEKVLSFATGVKHATGPGAMDRMIMRWPRVMLGTRAPVTAIQSLRCTLQGSIFFASTSLTVAMFSILVDENNRRRRLIYVIMATLLLGSVVFFAQQMRMVYHLNYLCAKRPKPHRNRNRMVVKHHIKHDDGADKGAFLLSAEANMNDEDFNEASPEFKHLQLECEMDLDDEAIRMAYILQRAVMNHGLGFRCIQIAMPLLLGLVNDVALVVATCIFIPFYFYYDIVLASTRSEPDDAHVRLIHAAM